MIADYNQRSDRDQKLIEASPSYRPIFCGTNCRNVSEEDQSAEDPKKWGGGNFALMEGLRSLILDRKRSENERHKLLFSSSLLVLSVVSA